MTKKPFLSRRDFAVLKRVALEGRPAYVAAALALGGDPLDHACLTAKALALDDEECGPDDLRDWRCKGCGYVYAKEEERAVLRNTASCPFCQEAFMVRP